MIRIVFHSWQMFLVVCAFPSLISGPLIATLPESPKFLMTAGRNDEAMEVFKTVYSMNTGNPPEYYPIKSLVVEESSKRNGEQVEQAINKSPWSAVNAGWKQIRPIFASPYLIRIIHIFSTLFLGLLGENTLRLWLPQLFTKIDEYYQMNNYTTTATLCQMLDVTPTDVLDQTLAECKIVQVDSQVYINTIVVGSANMIGFIIASSLVNFLGKKVMLVIMYAACGIAGVGNYWSTSAATTLLLVTIHGGVASICTSTMISVIVDLFPTTLRTMTISLGMMFGRCGSIIGNVLFPVLLETGCLPPFLLIGGTALICATLSAFLPNLKRTRLQ